MSKYNYRCSKYNKNSTARKNCCMGMQNKCKIIERILSSKQEQLANCWFFQMGKKASIESDIEYCMVSLNRIKQENGTTCFDEGIIL